MATREGYRWFRGGWQPSAPQRRVLDELVADRTNAEIAVRLALSPETVKSHIARMLGETGCADRADLARWWQSRPTRRPLFLPLLGLGARAAATLAIGAIALLFVVAAGPAAARFLTGEPLRRALVPPDPPAPAPSPPPGAGVAVAPSPTTLTAYSPPAAPAARVVQEIDVGDEPFYLAVGEGAVWVPNRRDGTLMRVDPESGAVVATILIGDPSRGGRFGAAPAPGVGASVAVAGGYVWVTKEDERAVAQVDPRTNALVGTIPLGMLPHRLAVGHGALWVTSRERGSDDGVLRVDLTARRVVAAIRTPVPGMLAVTDDAVWVGNVFADTVTRIDPRTNQIAAVVTIGGTNPDTGCGLCINALVATDGAVWAGYHRGGVGSELARIDTATNSVVAVVPVALNPLSGAADARGIWLSHFESRTVTRIDPATNSVVGASEMGVQLFDLVLDGDTAWVTSHPNDRLLRLTLLP